ncbi:MAG: GGDEF domain-containing protein [Oscillospiraceae bacterium]|jgi:diguanylate cyclase (GGDEF)-like protein|nr:GGDEF domain-containing protein [Oscillospiraceae bacterium]
MMAVGFVAFFVHVGFCILFLVHCLPLVLPHLLSLFMIGLSLILLKHKCYDLPGVLLGTMIIFSCLVSIAMIGMESYSILYLFMVLLMQNMIPYRNRAIPVACCIVLPLLIVGASLWGNSHVPSNPMTAAADNLLGVLNLLINATGVIILVTLQKGARMLLRGYEQRTFESLAEQAYHDPLTGLYNRRYATRFFQALHDEGEAHAPMCVAIADVDDYKQVNDRYGHEAGDYVLVEAAKLMRNTLRKADVVFRWGGDEFVLILVGADLEEAEFALNKLRRLVGEHPFTYGGKIFHVTLTIGLSVLDAARAKESIDQCDRKLYQGKHRGKNVLIV